jgi:predicted metalloprotease
MKWLGRRESSNVEDRRGMRPGRTVLGGGAILIVVAIGWLMGADPRVLLQQLLSTESTSLSTSERVAPTPESDERARFASVILAETEDVWRTAFQEMGKEYVEPHLVLFDDQVESACGLAGAAVGPFYCPGDSKVYLDLTFFDQLRQLGAPGDFAQAYVIAHEVGHHVQNLLGITERVHAMRERVSETEYNQLSVRLELQADFLAGMWAHHSERMRPMLEQGDIEEALNAASQIGDDRLQRRARGVVVPDAFTHGTSAQRMRWFKRGWETGDFSRGNTFKVDVL